MENGNLIYAAQDTDKLPYRNIIFYGFNTKNQEFDSLKIHKKISNLLSNLDAQLIYKPDSGYRIIYDQDIRFYHKVHYQIQAKIEK